MGQISWIHISDVHARTNGNYVDRFNSDTVLTALWRDIRSRENMDDRRA